MGYKRNIQGYHNPSVNNRKHFKINENTIVYQEEIEKSRERERTGRRGLQREKETEHRKNMNNRIVEIIAQGISQGWPKEEIVKKIESEFPKDKNPNIGSYIENWFNKYKMMEKKIRDILSKVKNEEISTEEADELINELQRGRKNFLFTGKDTLYSQLVQTCYEKNKNRMEEEER